MDKARRQIPNTPVEFYIQLYCKKRSINQDSEIITEATKSWVSLNKDEKQKFLDKYNKCQSKFKNSFADYLKRAEPYMKKKQSKGIQINRSNLMAPQNDGNLSLLSKLEDDILENNEYDNEDNTEINQISNNNKDADYTTHDSSNMLTEPVPPSVLSAKELFEKINGSEPDQSWTTLPNDKIRLYQNALLSIKRNYIKNYRMYLESLSSRQLFDHYKVVNAS